MTEIQTKAAVANHNSISNINGMDVTQAKTKRMLLAEVYVHKTRKINTNPNNDDEYGVFHIFEFADDPNIKITPKLSTNCTEPNKIIDVLRNSTGSDTPQLQRLIEKLCAQSNANKRLSENTQSDTSKAVSSGEIANGSTAREFGSTMSMASSATSMQASAMKAKIVPGSKPWRVEEPIPTPTSVQAPATTASRMVITVAIPKQYNTGPAISRATTAPAPTTVTKAIPQCIPTIWVNHPTAKATAPAPAPLPTIRVKTVESLQNSNQQSNSSENARSDHAYAVAKKRTTVNPVVRSTPINQSVISGQSNGSSNGPPNGSSNWVPVKGIPPKVVVNSAPKEQQPVKLWNNMMQINSKKPLELKITVQKNRPTYDKTSRKLPVLQPTEELIENTDESGSLLKIDQVYESVSEEFVEDLLEDITNPSRESSESSSPLLDTLVKEVETDDSTSNKNVVTFVHEKAESCLDYRCSICLVFNSTYRQYQQHMLNEHDHSFICEQCHSPFTTQNMFVQHLNESGGKCCRSTNSDRPYICIVDPPIILMRNEKVFAFRCKHCNLAFQNQRNYVQHAQRHAKLFRCKKCPTKPLPMDLMRQHLDHHQD